MSIDQVLMMKMQELLVTDIKPNLFFGKLQVVYGQNFFKELMKIYKTK